VDLTRLRPDPGQKGNRFPHIRLSEKQWYHAGQLNAESVNWHRRVVYWSLPAPRHTHCSTVVYSTALSVFKIALRAKLRRVHCVVAMQRT